MPHWPDFWRETASAETQSGVTSFGQLGSFSYLGMDAAIGRTMDLAETSVRSSRSRTAMRAFVNWPQRWKWLPMSKVEVASSRRTAEYLSLMRPPYWSKNLLVFVPAFLAGTLSDEATLISCAAGFLLVSMCASGTYILNDLVDVAVDREHATKRNRPLARESVSQSTARRLAWGLIVAAVCLAVPWNLPFAMSLAAYTIASLAYTLLVKKLVLLDALWLSGLHTSRLLMGVLVADVALSGWLIAFSMFFFFSLALAKRYSEITSISTGRLVGVPGRGYGSADGPLILSFGASGAMASLVVLSLYVTEHAYPARYYSDPGQLWLAVLIIGLWLIHIWRHAHTGTLTSDPVNYALRDRTSLILFALLMTTMLIAR